MPLKMVSRVNAVLIDFYIRHMIPKWTESVFGAPQPTKIPVQRAVLQQLTKKGLGGQPIGFSRGMQNPGHP